MSVIEVPTAAPCGVDLSSLREEAAKWLATRDDGELSMASIAQGDKLADAMTAFSQAMPKHDHDMSEAKQRASHLSDCWSNVRLDVTARRSGDRMAEFVLAIKT